MSTEVAVDVGPLKMAISLAITQICQQHFNYVESVHATGYLSFNVDNKEKVDVCIADVILPNDIVCRTSMDDHFLLLSATSECTENADEVVTVKCNSRRMKSLKLKENLNDNAEDKKCQVETKEIDRIRNENGTKFKTNCNEIVKKKEKLMWEEETEDFDENRCKATKLQNKSKEVELKNEDLFLIDGKSEKCFKCNVCNFTTNHRGHYREHTNRHENLRQESCRVCDKSFFTCNDLKRHVERVHKSPIECPQCHKSFATSNKVKIHLRVEHKIKQKMFSCQSCIEKFISSDLLKEHVNSKHNNICSVCGETFLDKRSLLIHRQFQHSHVELTCKRCNQNCPTKGALRKHMTQHRERDHGAFKCEICEKSYTSRDTLYTHKRALHGEHKAYQCERCEKSFNFSHSMRLHRLWHDGKRPYKCSHCNKSYLTSSHLKHHVLAIHENNKPFRCGVCDKKFPYENSLRDHSMIHTGERPFTCAFCGKSCISRSALRVHEDTHVDANNYTCDICQKCYKTPSVLRCHRRRHMSDGRRFICDVCGNRFMYLSNLEMHYSVHSKVRSHSCNKCKKSYKTYAALYSHLPVHFSTSMFDCMKCGKSFKTKERLKAHVQRHSGQKPFVCEVCNGAFPDKGGLRKHINTVHTTKLRFACPVCNKMCNRADNLRVHMKVHGNGELLKLSLKELAVNDNQLDKLQHLKISQQEGNQKHNQQQSNQKHNNQQGNQRQCNQPQTTENPLILANMSTILQTPANFQMTSNADNDAQQGNLDRNENDCESNVNVGQNFLGFLTWTTGINNNQLCMDDNDNGLTKDPSQVNMINFNQKPLLSTFDPSFAFDSHSDQDEMKSISS